MTASRLGPDEAVREMAAIDSILNPNRHRAPDTEAHQSANRNSVENNMRCNQNDNKGKNPMKEKTKNKP
jgi:hypothetical protein